LAPKFSFELLEYSWCLVFLGVVKTGDLLLCAGNVSLVGLSLSQAQSVIDDMLKRDEVSTEDGVGLGEGERAC
jgi:hypothetical protein